MTSPLVRIKLFVVAVLHPHHPSHVCVLYFSLYTCMYIHIRLIYVSVSSHLVLFDIILIPIFTRICHDHVFHFNFRLIYFVVTLIYLTHSLCLENTLPL